VTPMQIGIVKPMNADVQIVRRLIKYTQLACVIAFLSIINAQYAGAVSVEKQINPADSFKDFLQSPCVVSNISFVEHYSQKYRTTPPRYYEGCWQSNAYLLLDWGNSNPNQATNRPQKVYGKYNNMYWTLTLSQQQLETWNDVRNEGVNAKNSVAQGHAFGRMPLVRALNMGIEHAPISSIVFHADSLISSNKMLSSHEYVTGVIRKGLTNVESIVVHISVEDPNFTGTRTFNWSILYDYTNSSSIPFLPFRIRRFALGSDGVIDPIDDIEILSIVTNSSVLAEDQFSPNSFMVNGKTMSFTILSNGDEVYMVSNHFVKISDSIDPRLIQNMAGPHRYRRLVATTLIAVLIGIPFVWVVRNRIKDAVDR